MEGEKVSLWEEQQSTICFFLRGEVIMYRGEWKRKSKWRDVLAFFFTTMLTLIKHFHEVSYGALLSYNLYTIKVYPFQTYNSLALRIFTTILILIRLLILLMFQQTALIVLVLTYWQMIWYVKKKNIIKDNQITSFRGS